MEPIHIFNDLKPRPMRHTQIEYFRNANGTPGYAYDFLTGCNHAKTGVCPVGEKCWARGLALGRNKRCYPFGFAPTLWPDRLLQPLSIKKPSMIAVCFKGDLGGEWVDLEMKFELTSPMGNKVPVPSLRECVFDIISECPQHRFLFLTKNPAAWAMKWKQFPDNAWVGVTVCNQRMFNEAVCCLSVVKAKHKWISFEPLMSRIIFSNVYGLEDFSWVVIGGWSGGHQAPKLEWVTEIVEACRKAGIPYWLKNNLKGLDVSLMVNGLHQKLP